MGYFNNLKNDYKTKSRIRIWIFIILVVTIFFIIVFYKKRKNQIECRNMRTMTNSSVYRYLEINGLIPQLEGEKVIVNLQDVKKVMQGKKVCEGKVTVTNYKGEFVYTYNLSSCGICTTKKFSKEGNEYLKNKNQEVVSYYNYRTINYYDSKWTGWMSSNYVTSEPDENGLYLPVEQSRLPKLPSEAIIVDYVIESKDKYRYRDKKWKWYKNNNSSYSDFSSERPDGYTTKDENAYIYSDYSEWSLNYPEVKSYRTIKTATGYRWYTKKGRKKVYYNKGEYLVVSPGDEYKKDEKASAQMYRYMDKKWRWYNGTARSYTSYRSTASGNYIYKDEALTDYSSWSSWSDISHLDSSNSDYREQEIDTYRRYLIKYKIQSLDMLDSYVSQEQLEKKLGKSLEEIKQDESIDLLVVYKFKTEK